MSCGEYESYILGDEEIKFLLAGLGMERLCGILDSDGPEKMDTDTRNRALLSLYEKQVIDLAEGEVSIRPELSDFFRVILGSGQCISVHAGGRDMPVRCGYFSHGKVVMMERCQRREGTLKLSFWTQPQWILFLESIMEELASEYGRVSRKLEKAKTVCLEEEECLREENIAAVFVRRDIGKMEVRQKILIKENGLETYMILRNGADCVQKPYKKKELMRAVSAWMEEKNDTGRYLYSGDR